MRIELILAVNAAEVEVEVHGLAVVLDAQVELPQALALGSRRADVHIEARFVAVRPVDSQIKLAEFAVHLGVGTDERDDFVLDILLVKRGENHVVFHCAVLRILGQIHIDVQRLRLGLVRHEGIDVNGRDDLRLGHVHLAVHSHAQIRIIEHLTIAVIAAVLQAILRIGVQEGNQIVQQQGHPILVDVNFNDRVLHAVDGLHAAVRNRIGKDLRSMVDQRDELLGHFAIGHADSNARIEAALEGLGEVNVACSLLDQGDQILVAEGVHVRDSVGAQGHLLRIEARNDVQHVRTGRIQRQAQRALHIIAGQRQREIHTAEIQRLSAAQVDHHVADDQMAARGSLCHGARRNQHQHGQQNRQNFLHHSSVPPYFYGFSTNPVV